MAVPVPVIVRGRILRKFKKAGAIGEDNAKTLEALDMTQWPFTAFGSKRVFQVLLDRNVIRQAGESYYLAK